LEDAGTRHHKHKRFSLVPCTFQTNLPLSNPPPVLRNNTAHTQDSQILRGRVTFLKIQTLKLSFIDTGFLARSNLTRANEEKLSKLWQKKFRDENGQILSVTCFCS
jgi:hypothetical protein